jgi:hypothetical protein
MRSTRLKRAGVDANSSCVDIKVARSMDFRWRAALIDVLRAGLVVVSGRARR